MPDDDARVLAAIEGLVTERLGLRFDDDRRQVLARRLAHLHAQPGALAALRDRLHARDHDALLRIAEIASTNHTYFFREPEAFEYLATRIAPTLPTTGPIRLWSAAASSGEEAYSMMMTLAEALGRHAVPRMNLLGTDIAERQVRAAETAAYGPGSLNRVPPAYRHHLIPTAGGVRVGADLVARCTFRRLNLVAFPWPFARSFHVIFLRNVLYYFDVATRDRVVEACYDAAEPGAWLVVGLSEPLIDLHTRWRPVAPGLFIKGGAP